MNTNTYDVMRQMPVDPSAAVSQGALTAIHPEAKFSKDIFQQYDAKAKPWIDQFIENYDFYNGAQESVKGQTARKKKKQKKFDSDVIYQAAEQAVAMLTANNPRFTATGADDSDVQIAFIHAAIMQHVWRSSNATAHTKIVARDYYVGGMGWYYLYWDENACYGKGDFRIATLDPKNVRVTPGASDFLFDDAPHIVAESRLTSEMLQVEYNIDPATVSRFPESMGGDDTSNRVSSMNSSSSEFSEMTNDGPFWKRYDRWSKVKVDGIVLRKEDERFEKVIDTEHFTKYVQQAQCITSRRGDMTTYFVHPRNVANVSRLLSQFGEVFHTVIDQNGQEQLMSGVEGQVQYGEGVAPVPGSTTYLTLMTLRDALMSRRSGVTFERRPIDRIKHVVSIEGIVISEKILPTSYHVVIPVPNNFQRTPFPISDVQRSKEEQEFINAIRKLIVVHAGRTTNFKIGFPEGQFTIDQLEKIWGDNTKTWIPYSGETGGTGLHVIAPPPLPNHLYTLEVQARQNIQDRFGIYNMMAGSPADAPNSYRGTMALDEFGQRRIRSKREDMEFSIARIGTVLEDMLPYYYTDQRVIDIIGPNDKPMSITLTNSIYSNAMENNEYRIQDITVSKYDIHVVSGSTLPSNRWALLDTYRQLYLDGIIDQEEVLKKTEVADSEKVLERFSVIKSLQQKVAELTEQLKMISGDMQTAQREVINARREVEVTKAQADIKAETVKASAARMVYEKSLELLRQSHMQAQKQSQKG